MGRKARQHWYSLYQAIAPYIDTYDGHDSIYEVIRKEAEAAGYDPKVVKRMLNAGAFLDRLVDRPVTGDAVKCGYAHIEMLERLSKHDMAKAVERLEPVLANQLTLKELRHELDLSADSPGQAQLAARGKSRQRIAEHRRLSIKLAKIAGSAFFGSPHAEMVLIHKFSSLGQFILLNDPKKPIAVIPRLVDSSLKVSKAADKLIKLAQSYKPNFHHIWFVLPANSSIAQEFVAQACEIGAFDEWLYLAVPNEDGSELLRYQNRRLFLEKQVYGEDDDAWEGVSMVDGRPLTGNLSPAKN